jgi:hypothetical protein
MFVFGSTYGGRANCRAAIVVVVVVVLIVSNVLGTLLCEE